MTRQTRFNLGLGLLVAALALIVWLDQRTLTQAPPPITELDPRQVQRIRLARQGVEIILQRTPGGWQMAAPQAAPANPAQVEALLAIATAYSLERFPTPPELAQFGLAPPSAVVELDRTRIEVGGTQPVSHQRYLRIGDQIHLINDRFPHLLQASAERYILPPAQSPEADH